MAKSSGYAAAIVSGNTPHGQLVDCALRALGSSQHDHLVNTEVLLMAALLHDVGKAEEYIWNERQGQWKLSDRGALIGHKLTTLEWMAAAL